MIINQGFPHRVQQATLSAPTPQNSVGCHISHDSRSQQACAEQSLPQDRGRVNSGQSAPSRQYVLETWSTFLGTWYSAEQLVPNNTKETHHESIRPGDSYSYNEIILTATRLRRQSAQAPSFRMMAAFSRCSADKGPVRLLLARLFCELSEPLRVKTPCEAWLVGENPERL